MSGMTDDRSIFFLTRFKSDEKMLGPNEQAALDHAIARLRGEAQAEQRAVALGWIKPDQLADIRAHGSDGAIGVFVASGESAAYSEPIYTRPQPAAVADGRAIKGAMMAAMACLPDSVLGHPARMQWVGERFLRNLTALSSTAAPALSRVDPAVSAQLSEDVARQQATAAEIDDLCAPAPVAGDAVCSLSKEWRKEAGIQQNHSYARGLDRCAEQLDAALAQDRASQSLPSPVPGDQVGDIVARWMEKKLTAEQAMLVIKRHLDHCYMQPANDYNRGWVAGANSVTERAAELVEAAERASQAAPVDTSTNRAWIARAEAKLAAPVAVPDAVQCDQYVTGDWTGPRKCAFKAVPGDTLCKRHRASAERTGYAAAPTPAAEREVGND